METYKVVSDQDLIENAFIDNASKEEEYWQYRDKKIHDILRREFIKAVDKTIIKVVVQQKSVAMYENIPLEARTRSYSSIELGELTEEKIIRLARNVATEFNTNLSNMKDDIELVSLYDIDLLRATRPDENGEYMSVLDPVTFIRGMSTEKLVIANAVVVRYCTVKK